MTLVASTLFLLTMAPRWVPTFVQDFDGPAGQPPDPKVWVRDLGGEGWGNAEWQSYTDGAANAFLDGEGHLVIEARKEPTTGKDGIARDYSSARMHTSGRFSQAYGKFEARLKMPRGKGIWPAFWMMGDATAQAGWPGGGEIDIMEYLGHEPRNTYGTLHGPGYSGGGGLGSHYTAPVDLDKDFHVYGIEWDPSGIRWTFDGKVYATKTPEDVGTKPWVYDGPFYLILNLAVGGGWPGYPDATTTFPQRFVIDYVRVYRDANLKVDKAEIARKHKVRMSRRAEFKGAKVFSLPGTIVAADFRPGGYKDTDTANSGGQYRPTEGVDIGGSGVKWPKYSVGWIDKGEWLAYDVRVAKTGVYRAFADMACEGPGGTFRLDLNGKPLTRVTRVPDTRTWQNWRPVDLGPVKLTKGRHEVKIHFLAASAAGPVGNLLQLRFVR